MINFGVKTLTPQIVENGRALNPSTWYNEMLSMLCEDMLQSFLENEDKDSPKKRLSRFCSNYSDSGIVDWLSGDHVFSSYAMSYAFGAYLARNYGGASLIKKIATNNLVDKSSITAAIKEQGYTTETFDTVYKKFVQALLIQNLPNGGIVPSFNKNATQTLTYSQGLITYNYPMTAINLWSYDWIVAGKTYSGPAPYQFEVLFSVFLTPFLLLMKLSNYHQYYSEFYICLYH